MRNEQKGFTLVELLIVIAVIAILAAVAFVAIDPATRFAEARNAQRWTDVSATAEAIQQYIVDSTGSLPTAISTSGTYNIGSCTTGACTATGTTNSCANLTSALVSGYLPEMPTDPESGSATDTKYYVTVGSGGSPITVGACEAELSEEIDIAR